MPLWQPSQAISRPAYYDRDAISVIPTYTGNVGPHAATQRASYSPAFPYAAFIEMMSIMVSRTSLGAAAADTQIYFSYFPFSGGSMAALYMRTVLAAVAQNQTMNLTSFGYMAYGDTLTLNTLDSSTGGTQFFAVGAKGTEFLY